MSTHTLIAPVLGGGHPTRSHPALPPRPGSVPSVWGQPPLGAPSPARCAGAGPGRAPPAAAHLGEGPGRAGQARTGLRARGSARSGAERPGHRGAGAGERGREGGKPAGLGGTGTGMEPGTGTGGVTGTGSANGTGTGSANGAGTGTGTGSRPPGGSPGRKVGEAPREFGAGTARGRGGTARGGGHRPGRGRLGLFSPPSRYRDSPSLSHGVAPARGGWAEPGHRGVPGPGRGAEGAFGGRRDVGLPGRPHPSPEMTLSQVSCPISSLQLGGAQGAAAFPSPSSFHGHPTLLGAGSGARDPNAQGAVPCRAVPHCAVPGCGCVRRGALLCGAKHGTCAGPVPGATGGKWDRRSGKGNVRRAVLCQGDRPGPGWCLCGQPRPMLVAPGHAAASRQGGLGDVCPSGAAPGAARGCGVVLAHPGLTGTPSPATVR